MKAQVDESLNELRNRFNENLELIQAKFKENNVQIRAFIEKSQEASMAVLKESRDEQITLLEGRTQAFTVQSEQKLISKINSLIGRFEAINSQAVDGRVNSSRGNIRPSSDA